MLLNEFIKGHRKVQALETNVVRQQKQIEALTAGLQKVSATTRQSIPFLLRPKYVLSLAPNTLLDLAS
jgi:hypothetical protein